MNKRVKLPRPLGDNGEFQCEVKRRKYERVINTYIKSRGRKHVIKSVKNQKSINQKRKNEGYLNIKKQESE